MAENGRVLQRNGRARCRETAGCATEKQPGALLRKSRMCRREAARRAAEKRRGRGALQRKGWGRRKTRLFWSQISVA